MEMGHRKPKGNLLIFASSATNKSHHQASSFIVGLLEGFLCNTTRTPLPPATGWSQVQRCTIPMDFQMCNYTVLPSPSPITPTRLCFVSHQSIEPWWPPVVGRGPSPPLFPSSQSLLPLMISHYHCQSS